MDWLSILRILTLVARLTLLAAFLVLLIGYGREMTPRARRLWGIAAAVFFIVTLNYVLIELVHRVRPTLPATSLIVVHYTPIYSAVYLLNGTLATFLAFALLGVGGASRGYSTAFLAASALIAGLVLGALFSGALREWETLMDWNQALTYLGLLGYLAFCAFSLMGRMPHVDGYFLAFIGARTLFELLLPIQAIIFQELGRETAATVWHVNLILQFLMAAAQILIVMRLILALRAGRRPAPVAVV